MLAIPRAIPVRARSLALVLPVLLTGLLVLDATPAQAGVPTLDTRDRAAVAAAYHDVYRPAVAVRAPAPAAGTVARCDPGSTPVALQDATLDLVNYFRAMSGVGPVTFDPTYSVKAQQAALIGYANGTLSHDPSAGATCWSAGGAEAAARSNLGLGYAGADVVRAYMDDAGPGNIAAGHRWWLQRPTTRTMGNGTVHWSNALWVAGDTAATSGPRYTSWPAAGYLPAPLEPQGRWSFTSWDPAASLRRATVAVTGPDGTAVPLTQAPVDPTFGSLVFDLSGLSIPTGPAAVTYTVTVSGILEHGEPVAPYSYQVRLFDPDADLPLEAEGPLVVSGTPEVGQTLTTRAPRWSLASATTSYQWFRGGTAIEGATTPSLLLAAADLGHPITVRATATAAGRDPVAVTSGATSAVKLPALLEVTSKSPDQGQARLTVTVGAAGEPPVGGTLEIREGKTVVAADVPVTAGEAVWERSGVAAGARTYSVRYSGTDRVGAAVATTAVTVRGRTRPSVRVTATSRSVGALTLAVAVAATGEPALAGTVTVAEGTKVLASGVPVVDGRAGWTGKGLASGEHTYTVRYGGTSRVEPGKAAVTTIVKAKVAPKVTLRATSPSSRAVRVAVTVSASGQTALGGRVTVKEGGKTLGSKIAVKRGTATWSATRTASGRHTYTVVYSGTSQVTTGSAKVAVTVRR